jgi:hypothetical protein
MFGTLTYICLDVSFNIVYWVGFKTISGTAYSIGSIYYYISSYNYNRNNGIEAIEYTKTTEPTTKTIHTIPTDNTTENNKTENNKKTDNTTADDIYKNEYEDEKNNSLNDNEIKIIKNQISNQAEVIKELKTKINLLEDKLTQKEFEQNFNDELANN